jgi:hypothetical protein
MHMASIGLGKAPEPEYLANQVVTVEQGNVDRDTIYVKPRGTVQFVNKDKVDYQVRLFMNQEHFPFDLEKPKHTDVDFMLLALGGFTLVVDEKIAKGQCKYQLTETDLDDLATDDVATEQAATEDFTVENATATPESPSGQATASLAMAANSSKSPAGKGGGGIIIIGG